MGRHPNNHIVESLFLVDKGAEVEKVETNQARTHTPLILALGRLKQEGCKFKASLDYLARPCLKQQNKTT
jgi:hypothetical protein